MSRAPKSQGRYAGRDATRIFHREWLGLAQPIEGLVFSVPALDEAPAPAPRAEITTAIRSLLVEAPGEPAALRSTRELFETFLGYSQKGALVSRADLPESVSFYAPESRQQLRPSFAIARTLPVDEDDPFAVFARAPGASAGDDGPPQTPSSVLVAGAPPPSGALGASPRREAGPTDSAREGYGAYIALVWDLADDLPQGTEPTAIDLDKPEDLTGAWNYPPTAKLERLLRHLEIPVGFLSNRRHLRVVYAPKGEATSHLTFRLDDLADPAGRPLAQALELLFHARRTYTASPQHTFEGLLAESRRRQADVTEALAEQVFTAVERLLSGYEAAAIRDTSADRPDWMRAAMEAGDVYQGVLNVVLRLVFLLYAEDRSLLPVDHPTYSKHLSVLGLYERLSHDAGAHPESMHQRYGAYGALVSLFRAIYFGVQHGSLRLPARQGRLFDPSAYPFLEGGMPEWTAAVSLPDERAQVRLPTVDDGTLYEVLHALVVLDGQRISYRDLSVEQIGAVYESLMGFTVERIGAGSVPSPAVRLGKLGYWVEVAALQSASKTERDKILSERCELSKSAIKKAHEILEGKVPSPGSPAAGAQSDPLSGEGATSEARISERGDTGVLPRTRAEGAGNTAGTTHSEDLANELLELAGKKSERERHRARAGQLVLQPTASRRSTGSHYTPRSLSEKVVRRTLEPILACLTPDSSPLSPSDLPLPTGGGRGVGPTANQILELKVCDPAMGSGAFLVEACRFLGAAVVEAWRRSGELPAMLEKHGDPLLHAKRLVAQKCLYGVDKNAAAVELAKLSLWLETLSGDRPFTFLDHVLRHGDSLVGLDLDQVRAFHWSPDSQLPTVATLVNRALAEVKEHRDAIQSLADDETDAAQRDKRRLHELANHAMEKVKLVADVCVGAFFAEPKKKAREEERNKRLGVVETYLSGDTTQEPTLRAWADTIRNQHAPFHWHLELPEVFFLERPDPLEKGEVNKAAFMDAFVGNPPFMGVAFMTERLGDGYVDWLQDIYPGVTGKFDLAALFLRRAAALIGAHGSMGFITTNTVAQGDTRASGLQRLLTAHGCELVHATRSLAWPGDAAVTVSVVHLAVGAPRQTTGARTLDDAVVPVINSRLLGFAERPDPTPLRANSGSAFVGVYLLGLGFVLTPDERDTLVARDSHNALRIRPYLGGDELNTHPTHQHDRFAIHFGQCELAEAEQWPDLVGVLRDRVKAERESKSAAVAKAPWWQYWRDRPELTAALASHTHCLVISRHTKHLAFARLPVGPIFSEATNVFALAAFSTFATLQSRLHEAWARLLSSSLEDRLRYAASDCFETFPFPQPDPRTVIPELEDIGQRLYDKRAAYMIDTQQGLTQTYNKLKDPACTDPEILELRRLHEDMDAAVLRAYGWPEIQVPPFCPLTPEDQKSLETFQDQVIDHLFVLNAERAKEEARLGAGSKKAPKAKPTKAKPKKPPPDQGTLF